MRSVTIIILCVLGSVIYGVAHDMITARVCVEYFTIGHPKLMESTDPTVLAFVWGVLATWWVGLILGVALAVTTSVGTRPKFPTRTLLKWVTILLLVMGVVASLAGVVGWALARNGVVVLVDSLADLVPAERHVRFIATGWAHAASYLVGIGGGTVLVFLVWRARGLEMIRLMAERRRTAVAR